MILYDREDLLMDRAPQLPFTNPEMGGGGFGTQ